LINKGQYENPSFSDFYPVLDTQFSQIYTDVYQNATIQILHQALINKFAANPYLQQLLCRTEQENITEFHYMDPFDIIMGYQAEFVNICGFLMNQTGKLLLQIRSNLNPDLKKDYAFFSIYISNHTDLQAWLKKKLLDLRQSLQWFQEITSLTSRHVRVFFTKIYTPYHTIYRYYKSRDTKFLAVNAYIREFFASITVTEEVLQYIFDHFSAMVKGSLEMNGDSLDALSKNIFEGVSLPQIIDHDNTKLMQTVLTMLEYLPKRYSDTTLSRLLTILMGSPTLIAIPPSTFTLMNNVPFFYYSNPSFISVFHTAHIENNKVKGDLGFLGAHIDNYIAPDRYQFFFGS
jgi:hypothetical protein